MVFVVALLPRVAWVLVRWVQAGAELEFPDEELHWQLARNLVHDGALVSDDGRYAARMPGYPFFLATCAWAGESGILLARLLQALLGAATAWIGYGLARRGLGWWAALVAGALLCFDPYAVFFTNLLLTEVLFTFLAVALTSGAFALALGTSRAARAAAVGVAVLGMAALMTRPSAAGWIVLLWVALWVLDTRRGRGTKRLALYLVLMAAGLLPWGWRNHAVIGAPAWLSTNGGVTLYDGQGPQADGSSDQRFLHELPGLAELDEIQRDRELHELALKQMRADPRRVLELAWVKLRRTWSLTPNVSEYRGGPAALASGVFTAVTLMLVLLGLLRTLAMPSWTTIAHGETRRLHLLLWLPVIYFTLVHCVFIGSLRYRVPLMPFVEIGAAAAFVQGLGKRSEGT